MPFNHSPLSYADCKGALDKALESERGVKIERETEGAATRLIHRLHAFRKMDRKDNKKIYPEDHPMHGLSVYDKLIIKKRNTTVIIEPVTESSIKVELL